MIHEQYEAEEKLKEECGVFGMYDFDGGDVASAIYYGLFALQHRGQESCGIAVSRSEERRVGKECRSRWSPYH